MKHHDKQQQDDHLSLDELMRIKSEARDKLVRAVREADEGELNRAAESVKSALRGNSADIARPRRFSSL